MPKQRLYMFRGTQMNLSQIAEFVHISRATLSHRVNNLGMDIEDAVKMKPQRGKNIGTEFKPAGKTYHDKIIYLIWVAGAGGIKQADVMRIAKCKQIYQHMHVDDMVYEETRISDRGIEEVWLFPTEELLKEKLNDPFQI